MQPALRFGLTCSLVTFACACGGVTTPKPEAQPSKPAALAPLQQLPAAPDLTPVAAPSGLFAVGRLARPGDLLKALAGWVSLPFEPSMIDALQPGLSQAVAFDAPLEFAVALPENTGVDRVEPELVATVGLTSVDRARALLEEHVGKKLRELKPSVYVTPDDARVNCAIAASVGKAPARLVCGDNPKSLEHLLPYATRGLPLENLGASDLHAELRVEPLHQRFGAAARMGRTVAVPVILKELSLSDPRFDRPLAELAHAFGDELLDVFDDTSKIALDISASSKPEQLDLKMSWTYRGRTSWLSQATADARRRMAPPGAQFFDLPADSAWVGYGAAPDPKRWSRPRDLIGGLIEGFLAHLEVAAPLRRDVKTAFDALFGTPSPVVYAMGTSPLVSQKAKVAPSDLFGMALGWRIQGVEAPAGPYKDALKTIVRLGSDKTFRKGLDALGHEPSEPVATSGKKKPATGKDKKTRKSEWIKFKGKAIVGMPTGSEVAVVEFNHDGVKELQKLTRTRGKKGKVELAEGDTLSFYVGVVPDGSRTWIVAAADDKTLLERSKAVIGSGTVARLSTRGDIASLRGQNATLAGYATLQLAKGFLGLALSTQGKKAHDADTLFSTLPHHGNTPMFYRAVVVGNDQRPGIELSTVIPRAIFDDGAAAVPSLMMLFP